MAYCLCEGECFAATFPSRRFVYLGWPIATLVYEPKCGGGGGGGCGVSANFCFEAKQSEVKFKYIFFAFFTVFRLIFASLRFFHLIFAYFTFVFASDFWCFASKWIMWNQAFFSLRSETKFSLQFQNSLPKRKWGRTLIRTDIAMNLRRAKTTTNYKHIKKTLDARTIIVFYKDQNFQKKQLSGKAIRMQKSRGIYIWLHTIGTTVNCGTL